MDAQYPDLLLSVLEGPGAVLRIGDRASLRRNPKSKGIIRHVGAVHFAHGDFVGLELGAFVCGPCERAPKRCACIS